MLRPEPLDVVIIALVAMLLFGRDRLPASGRSIGKTMREFKAAITGEPEETPPARKPAATDTDPKE